MLHDIVYPRALIVVSDTAPMMLRYSSRRKFRVFPATPYRNMTFFRPFRTFLAVLIAFAAISPLAASAQYKSLEVDEKDGIPVIVKHLPEWETVKDKVMLTNSVADLKQTLGARPVLDAIEMTAGAEAATADYPAGRLLLIEHHTPQFASSNDAAILAKLAETGDRSVVYKRIGNYNAFVFDAADPAAAEALLGQIKYEKAVQWLGEDPFFVSKVERYLVGTTGDVLVSTALFIVMCLAGAVAVGLLCGYVYFMKREQRRLTRTAFSDAGGLTRLNLDELTE